MPKDDLVQLFKEMSELTAPVCATGCPNPHSCCAPEHCESAAKYANEYYGVDLVRTDGSLPFMREYGCSVAPHLRPKCTLHNCHMAGRGFWPFHSDFNNKYLALRMRIERTLKECRMNWTGE